MVHTRNRVVLTGMGVVAPNGIGVERFWASLLAGKSGIREITLFDASRHTCKFAGEVAEFSEDLLPPNARAKRMARQTQLALVAGCMAVENAGIHSNGCCRDDQVPLIVGVSSNAIDIIEPAMERMFQKGPGRVPSYVVHSSQPQQAASVLGECLPFVGEAGTVSSACAAGVEAVAYAADRIRRGLTNIAIAGGTDAPVNAFSFACFAKAGLVPPTNSHPEKASRPFDRNHVSGIISEGAAFVVLEKLEHALSRGARPLLEITGYSSHADTDPAEAGSGLQDTMREALANACRRASDVDYISAHGPGHPVLDRMETAMIKRVFGRDAYRIPVASIKGVIGNPLAAAGVMQLISCALSFRDDRIPPTANLEEADAECDLDYVPHTARHARIRCAMINAHGLGGGNSSMLVERVDIP